MCSASLEELIVYGIIEEHMKINNMAKYDTKNFKVWTQALLINYYEDM